MENQRTFLFLALLAISAVLYQKWIEFNKPVQPVASDNTQLNSEQPASAIPSLPEQTSSLPATPLENSKPTLVPQIQETRSSTNAITITTDLIIATINQRGGTLEGFELLNEPISLDKPDQGFPLLKNTADEIFVAQDGLLVSGQADAPNHLNTDYQVSSKTFDLGDADKLEIPLGWVSANGVRYTKVFTFTRDSYVVDIDYRVENNSTENWQGYQYAQFSRTEPTNTGGGFGQLPSYTGGATYTTQDKYQKIKFKEMRDEDLSIETDDGWVAMLQHYFVAAWMPNNDQAMRFYSTASKSERLPIHRIGYKSTQGVVIPAGARGSIGTRVYLGPKQQSRLKSIAKQDGVEGLALTVDYGWLTFIADPLFTILSWIHDVVGNWGWSIILLTILIKLAFYPLSAASYRSMAGMRKLQPRIQTLKERYKDDRQKFQMEMMALYKKEKINPAGGCLPILVQIPVFIALYWALLESVEIRQAPFALWLQDLSAPDPFYILPVLMGVSMWAQQKLNPAPMDEIQKKVMTIMPIALTFLFLTFPQGLVLYWVVNNVLSMAQQWFIYKQLEA